MTNAIGLIESKGLVALFEAADVILKNSPVKILGIHKLDNGLISLAIAGNADYVKAAIESGSEAGRRVGEIYASSVVENPDKKLLTLFSELFADVLNERSSTNLIAEINNQSHDDKNFTDSKVFEEKSETKRAQSKPLLVTKITSVDKRKTRKQKSDKGKNKNKSNKPKKNRSSEPESDIVNSSRSEKETKISNSVVDQNLSTIERLRLEALGINNKSTGVNEETNKTQSKPLVKKQKTDIPSDNSVDLNAITKMNVHKLRHYARGFVNFPIKGRAISRAGRDELVELFNSIANKK